jgi:Flp pilus assembly protein TadG
MCPRTKERAQTLVEFALVVPVLLLILAGTVEFGRAFWEYGVVLQAVQEGARFGAALGNANNDTAIATRVQQVAAAGGLTVAASSVTVTATCSYLSNAAVPAGSRTRGNILTVSLRYSHSVLMPFLPEGGFTLAPASSMQVEQGAPSTC